MTLPSKVRLYEVGPRDGLQNEKKIIPVDVKVALINRLSETGLTHIEATSFVSPRFVPQMGDATEVMEKITRRPGVTYPVLVPNEKGMRAAIKANVTEIAIFTAASESFTQKNINCTIAESIERFTPVIKLAQHHHIKVRGYVSCVAGCPYEGDIAPEKVAAVSKTLFEAGCYEISLGDTIGIGTPDSITAMIEATKENVPGTHLALHCHATYGRALENIKAGLEQGITVIDSSVGGLGGCPYAEGSSGNVATEDVLQMLNSLGIETGVSLDKILETARYIKEQL
ncbi:MAG: hydroxymethylglutaryl-CoA lyase [Alphaproteobacteria bacterium CG_4_9_14_3_um_filter_47_13]|nr:MAG: hydroxymethylglutaryl-CoA lyase [Alphaproteobacteria bacterium CG_4_9_14_3_um_filter_47_13]